MKAFAAAALAVLFVAALGLAIGLSSGAIAAPGDTVRLSVTTPGDSPSGGQSKVEDISPSGRFVVFNSTGNLTPEATANQHVYLRDRDADEDGIFDEGGGASLTWLISVPTSGPIPNSPAYNSSVSADGRYVSFMSTATTMVPGDTNNFEDVFVRDRVAMTTTRVSLATDGTQGNNPLGYLPGKPTSISDSGRFVAFCSRADSLVSGDGNEQSDVFLRDRDTDEDGIYDEAGNVSTVRVSEALGGGDSHASACSDGRVEISGNGQFVAFSSNASDLVASDTNQRSDVFLWDRLTGTSERVSVSSTYAPAGPYGDSSQPSISSDGRYMAFMSEAYDLVVPNESELDADVFLRDRLAGTTERVSLASGGGEPIYSSEWGSVSDDGRYVAFESSSTNIVTPDFNGGRDIFLRDLQLDTTERSSVFNGGNELCGVNSSRAVISGDGVYVVFSTGQVYSHERGGVPGTVCPTPTPPTPTPIPGGSGSGSVFTPTTGIKLCNGLPASGFGDGSVSGSPSCTDAANDGLTVTNTLPSGNVYHSSSVTFVPSGGTPSAGTAGSLAGGVRTTASFGISNAPCNLTLDEDFVLYNVALPDNVGDPRSSTNIVYPMAVGTPDRFSKWKVGSAPTGIDPSGIDTAGDPYFAVGTSLAFNNYPSYLLDTFDADGVGGAPPLYPQAVYGALTHFGGQWMPLFLVKLAPSSMPSYSPAFPAGVAAKPAMGSALIWVLGDPTDGVPTPDNITDTCAPSTTTITLTGSTSMATGTNYYLEYLSSNRDTDQDGYENTIDTCPVKVNAGNPRTGTGDMDGDGIDDICDPATPTPVAPADFDGDGFVNRHDNCALTLNASQSEAERLAPAPADKGPVVDYIGDDCDSESGTRAFTQNGLSNTIITLSDTVANGRYMTVTNVVAKCVGDTDADGDGYCAAQDMGGDSGACQTTAPPSCLSRHVQWSGATFPAMQMDTDLDKVADALETYVGTDPVQSCSAHSSTNNEWMDNWMFDLNDNTTVSGQDSGPFGGAGGGYGKMVVEGPFNGRPGQRYDFNNDGLINGADTGKFGGPGPYGGTGPFSKSCTTSGIPAFLQQ